MNYLEIILWISFGLLLYTYIIYPILLHFVNRLISSNSSKISQSSHALPSVSIVIAAYNEEKIIAKKLENCLQLDYPSERIEVFVASDGSSDRTNDIVKTHLSKDNRIHLVELPRTGKSGVLNRAMNNVQNEIVVFSDANTEFDKNALIRLVTHFDDPAVGCVCGRLIYRNPGEIVSGEGESFYWRYETALKKMESRLGYVAGANGAIYAIRRCLFEPLPRKTINDDFVISMRIVEKGYKSLYEEDAVAYEDVAPGIESEFNRHVRDGAGHYIAMTHLLGLLNPFLGIRSFIYWSHRILRWIAPFILVLLFLINIGLISHTFYRNIFILQFMFYILAIIGLLMVKYKGLPFILYIPFYFCNLNLALLFGFFRAVMGKQKMTWERTERA